MEISKGLCLIRKKKEERGHGVSGGHRGSDRVVFDDGYPIHCLQAPTKNKRHSLVMCTTAVIVNVFHD